MVDLQEQHLLPGLKAARKRKGWTQEKLANAIGVDKETVSRWERGFRTPDLATVHKLAATLDCTPAELLTAPVSGPPNHHTPSVTGSEPGGSVT